MPASMNHQAVVVAETFADHLMSGRIQEATRLLAPVTQAIGGPIKLQDLWRQVMTNFGKMVGRETLLSHPQSGAMVVYLKLKFERGALPAYAVCTMDGKVMGFILKRPNLNKAFDFIKNPEQYRKVDFDVAPEPESAEAQRQK